MGNLLTIEDDQKKIYPMRRSSGGGTEWNWVALAVADLAGLLTAVISGVMMGECY